MECTVYSWWNLLKYCDIDLSPIGGIVCTSINHLAAFKGWDVLFAIETKSINLADIFCTHNTHICLFSQLSESTGTHYSQTLSLQRWRGGSSQQRRGDTFNKREGLIDSLILLMLRPVIILHKRFQQVRFGDVQVASSAGTFSLIWRNITIKWYNQSIKERLSQWRKRLDWHFNVWKVI